MKKAFTLIELLVVIAIIAILAAILFPVFAQAKLAAKKTQTISNMKQLTLGVLMYNNDSDGEFDDACPPSWYYPNTNCGGGWSWDVSPYIKNAGVFADPSDNMEEGWQTWFTGQPAIKVSYASNGYIRYTNGGWNLVGLMGFAQAPDSNGPNNVCGNGWMASDRINETSITQSAGTILLALRFNGSDIYGSNDVMAGVPPSWQWDGGGANEIPTGTGISSFNGYSQVGAYTINGPKGTYTVNQDGRYGAVGTIYNNSTPFSFADGHAKAMNALQTDPDPNNNEAANMWDSTR